MVYLLCTRVLIRLLIIKLPIPNSLINIIDINLITDEPGLWLLKNLLIHQFAIWCSEGLLQSSTWFPPEVNGVQKVGEVLAVGASLSDEGLDVRVALGGG